ncbi:MAG TPA: enoyl-CoA hydratase-related protein [Blastocatellia bacterium]
MSEFKTILYAVRDGIARIRLNRPEKRNALNDHMVAELMEAIRMSAGDGHVRVVLLEGSGKDFCSGADISALEKSGQFGVERNLENARKMASLFIGMRRHPRPIVAAIRGRALAGGCGLATATDMILAAESAKFGYPEVHIGFIPAIVMAILRRSISEKQAFEMITSGQIISAHQALNFGLINHVYPDDRFEEEVNTTVTAMAGRSASAVSLSKMLLYHMDGLSFEAAIESGVHFNAIARMTDDFKAGVEQFLKKPPNPST